jgi:hypothetical protein
MGPPGIQMGLLVGTFGPGRHAERHAASMRYLSVVLLSLACVRAGRTGDG